ncbi:hypothetical protein PENPOL_c007G07400 [Penicillium polonicum]|uniref:Uncharacterized protein n=1 Tax=Penicillium polonicum TaxID=60169 RepID=A0A1V6NJ63_PENPO|nr:hypothetical protein PENPOL_c007G07400 [Penicillium polonicum]
MQAISRHYDHRSRKTDEHLGSPLPVSNEAGVSSSKLTKTMPANRTGACLQSLQHLVQDSKDLPPTGKSQAIQMLDQYKSWSTYCDGFRFQQDFLK